jgi:hypothetical protein
VEICVSFFSPRRFRANGLRRYQLNVNFGEVVARDPCSTSPVPLRRR